MYLQSTDKKYEKLLKNIDSYFSASKHSLHKARNEIKTIDFENEKLVVKAFKIPHFINRIAYTFFRESKAKKSYHNSLRLGQFAPKPVGYVEFFKNGLIAKSYFVSENVPYDFTIREPLVESDFPEKEQIFTAFAHFTWQLHEAGVEHLDYSPGNILIQKIDGKYHFKIVDVNRMRFHTLSPKKRLENFAKLWAKDEDLKCIVNAYADLISMQKEEALRIALTASQRHKNRKNFKKRLKGLPVVD